MNKISDHICCKSAKIFVDTIHKNDYTIYYDALTVFLAADAYEHMGEKGYYPQLIVLQNDLSQETVYTKQMVIMWT